ncbi:MATE family efflux transporter [Aminipila terrae]|uniref:Probable multidrug resistance protein NorM n=1 Tax=Aminipila terrae TaxID=2697030 RepID=A0A6P1MFA4_9FIRM|nr:MATE family efflux transporter [Aminipila terrae]QHI72722.1 MATE family efflux transporter [Aminipila terrae]
MFAKIGSNNLTEGKISRQLFLFAIPLLLGNLLQQVYFITDSIIVGQCLGSTALAAVGTASSITILMVNFFTGIANGTGIILAQYAGAGDNKKLGHTIRAAAIFTVIFGVICSITGVIFSPDFLNMMDTPSDVFPQANNFLTYCFAGMLPMLIYNMGAASLQAMGDSRTPLYFLSSACIVNVILDLIFIQGFGMDVEGTAIATCIAQALAAALVFIAIKKKIAAMQKQDTEQEGSNVMQSESEETGTLAQLFKRILILGLPIGMQSVVINFSNIVVQSHINSLGSDVMAAWSAFCRLDGFIILPFMSFSLAVMTFTGQNFGAKKTDRIFQGVKSGLIMSCGFTVVLEILIVIFAEPCFEIFTRSDEVIAYACNMVYYMVPFYFMMAAARVYTGVISGTGNSITPMIINILFMCAFRVAFLPFGAHMWGRTLMVVYYTYWVSWILSLVSIMAYYYFKMKRKIIILSN